MTYKEKWQKLKEQLEKTELEMLIKANEDIPLQEKKRLSSKAHGLSIAQEYMKELDSCL